MSSSLRVIDSTNTVAQIDIAEDPRCYFLCSPSISCLKIYFLAPEIYTNIVNKPVFNYWCIGQKLVTCGNWPIRGNAALVLLVRFPPIVRDATDVKGVTSDCVING
jgi:hypothetical protein